MVMIEMTRWVAGGGLVIGEAGQSIYNILFNTTETYLILMDKPEMTCHGKDRGEEKNKRESKTL